jgi:hypothetical protein
MTRRPTPPPVAELTPERAAFEAMAVHCTGCPTCLAVDQRGVNLNLPCDVGDSLYEEYQRARRSASARARKEA